MSQRGLHTTIYIVLGAPKLRAIPDDYWSRTWIGVHIAARVLNASQPGEVLVSPPVPMLVAGAGFEFGDRGEYGLKGVPGTWRLFAVKH